MFTALALAAAVSLAGNDDFQTREAASDILTRHATTHASWRTLRRAYDDSTDPEVRHRIKIALNKNVVAIVDTLLPPDALVWFDIEWLAGEPPPNPYPCYGMGEGGTEPTEEALALWEKWQTRAFLLAETWINPLGANEYLPLAGVRVGPRYGARAWATYHLRSGKDIDELKAEIAEACKLDAKHAHVPLADRDAVVAEFKKHHPHLLNKGYRP